MRDINLSMEDVLKMLESKSGLEPLKNKFDAMNESDKMNFCRQLEDSWNNSFKDIYKDIIRDLMKKTALNVNTLEGIMANREALKMYQMLEKRIMQYIKYRQNHLNKIQGKGTSFKN